MKKTHFRIRGFYCKRAVPHEGPCPMEMTLLEKIKYRLKTGHWHA